MAIVNNAINLNALNPLSPLDGGLGVSNPTAHGILVAEGASAATPIVLTNGEVLIGSTGADPVGATLTAGTGITITNGAGSISIAASAPGMSWVDETTSSVTMVANTGYTADAGASLITFTLPTSASIGDPIEINGKGAGLWKIAQGASQQIQFGNTATTAGTGGSIASSLQYDCIRLRALTAGATSTWVVVSAVGNLTVT